MCANIGVDPLASNKGMWAQLLGLGDFYYELGVQVIEACLATRAHNGGLIELHTLQQHVQVGVHNRRAIAAHHYMCCASTAAPRFCGRTH